MVEGQTWRPLNDVHKSWPIWWVHTWRRLMIWTIHGRNDQCRVADATFYLLKLLAWCLHLLMPSIVQCRCFLVDVRMPQLMLVGLGWCNLRLSNVARLKCTNLGWCCLMLNDAYVTQPMHTRHARCKQASVDVAFHWPTLLARCAHAMFDAWRPWLMQPTVDWHCLTYACRLQSMLPSRYVHAMDNVCKPLSTLFSIGRCRLDDACMYSSEAVGWVGLTKKGQCCLPDAHMTF